MSKPDLEIFCTKDPKILQQYYDLRHNSYRDDNGWRDFNGAENDFDRQGHIVIAMKNGEVISGARLMFSDECRYLSSEIPGTQFEYKKFIRKYDNRDEIIIGEISSMVVQRQHRNRSVSLALIDFMIKKIQDHNCDYMFAVAVIAACRDYRMLFNKLNYYLEIIINYPWKEKRIYNFVRTFPIYIKLK
jgi:hypothetical protein